MTTSFYSEKLVSVHLPYLIEYERTRVSCIAFALLIPKGDSMLLSASIVGELERVA